jgi:tetrapyrrole methylase family protein / MazG family protein
VADVAAADAPAATEAVRAASRMPSLQVLDPDEPYYFDPTVPVVVRDLASENRRQRAYSILRRTLRDADEVTFVYSDGREERASLEDLQHSGSLAEVRTSAVQAEGARRSISGARAIVARLRGPGGCPWDREQTPESLTRFVLEEAYEVAEAIRQGTASELADELGDLLLQVLLQSEIANETSQFDFDDVLEALTDKLVRRHPHVFGDVVAESSDQVLKNWDQIKSDEKPRARKSALAGVGKGLPSLMAAQAVQRRARSVGFDWPAGGARRKFEEELQELREASSQQDVQHELGDVLFMAARIGLEHDIDAEVALAEAIGRVQSRFGYVEARLEERGDSVSESDPDELERLWSEAKLVEQAENSERDKSGR